MTAGLLDMRMAWREARERMVPRARRWASPLDMAVDLDPARTSDTGERVGTIRTPALNVINDALVRLATKPGQGRLAVFVSPQEGKSTTCSYWNPLWLLVNNPDLRIITVSYNAEKSREWGAEVKNAIENFSGDDGMEDLGLRLRTDTRAAGRWKVEGHRGGLYCAGIESGITGRPGDYIIVDDPTKNLQEAQSPARRGKVTSTYRGAIIPRMGPTTKLVWIQTLWHESETIQEILANEGDSWEVVRIPAICDSEDDPLGRAIGEPMQSARGDRDWAKTRRDVGEYVFSALYQQRPSPAEGGLFKRIHWRYFTLHDDRVHLGGREFDLRDSWIFVTADLAASTRTSADYTVFCAWARTIAGDLVLLDLLRAKIGEHDHFAYVHGMCQRWNVDTVFVEASQFGTTLVREATQQNIPVTPLKAEQDKFSRALPASAWVSGGRVWLRAGAAWTDAFVTECAAFPNGRNDDQVDCLAYSVRVAVTRTAPMPSSRTAHKTPPPVEFPELGGGAPLDLGSIAL